MFMLLPARMRHYLFIVYGLLTRAMTMGVRVAIIDETDRVFLVRHTYVSGWHLPGGGVERGETVEEAARKEAREEGNIVFNNGLDLFAIYRNKVHSRFDHVALFIARNFEQTAEFSPNAEISEAGFFAVEQLPDGTTKATRQRLAEIFDHAPREAYW